MSVEGTVLAVMVAAQALMVGAVVAERDRGVFRVGTGWRRGSGGVSCQPCGRGRCACGCRDRLIERGGFRVEALDFDAECALKVEDLGALVAGEECRGNAVLAGSASAAYSVDEIFSDLWEVEVDDVGDVVDVDTARGQVSGYQDADSARLEIGQGGGALGL